MKQFFKNLQNALERFLNILKQFYNDKFAKTYDHKIVFIDDKHMSVVGIDAFDIILSPKFYWTKIQTLPVKYAFQAKEYAPSVFDGFIPKGDYSYKAVNQNGKFLFFAYDVKSILENLDAAGIKPALIRKVYFAQTEFASCPYDIKIDAKNALIIREGKVIKAPLSIAKECVGMDAVLQTIKPSKITINLGKFNRIYEKQGALKGIIYALIFLNILVFAELFYLSSIVSFKENQKEEILKQYSMPSTEIQLNALLKQYGNINNEQKTIREKISEVFKFPFLEGEYFKSIEAAKTHISLILHVNGSNRGEAVKSYFQKYFTISEFQEAADNIKMELRYE
ncbi:MAG: hypothetical protein LBP54_06650 [Campylobacteraceae bacterium]|nr:hypothetical protein [Campylobacteraceae bacterium]